MRKLICKETIDDVEKMLKNENVSFEQYEISPNETFTIGSVSIKLRGTSPCINLPENLSGVHYSEWLRDVGKLLLRDLSRGEYDRIFELRSCCKKVLLHKITEDETSAMQESGFAHVKIGDFWFTILRVLPEGVQYSSTDYESAPESSVEETYCSCITEIPDCDSQSRDGFEDEYTESMSLFDDEDHEYGEEDEPDYDFDV